ncbi:hypothetical protein H1230_27535 [Paenibacillus sp. 19GGS1-52]|uniref:hypothetical protein n=1 Tax=Paenibacillus sp. 19GGS1-52 TaxID=2758563 RepID=UPI001EFAE183|nr:hypothetical protein [Paenibacillus sp. 19GGS1-52]ULO06701.1 hypothetical protein H1230_27535 [Paenibacillus sp. 19GGS1-52]
MDWLHDFEEELRLVFQESRSIISKFPEPLNSQGISYLDHFNVFTTGSHKNYICYLLPFWFQNGYNLSPDDTRKMSMGNVFFMLYFFIQDDLIDNTDSAHAKLPLANLLYIEFLNIYRSYFAPYSPFWFSFNRYISQWADSVSHEKEQDYFLNDRVKIAHKASPLKLSSTSILLLSGNDSLVAQAEDLIDDVLLTLQMLDDYEDWEQDLAEDNYNCLLSLTRSQLPDDRKALTEGEVKDFIFTSSGLNAYAKIAQATHNKLTAYEINAPQLISFHLVLVRNLQHISAAIEAEKQILQSGGLYYWLSKNIKK